MPIGSGGRQVLVIVKAGHREVVGTNEDIGDEQVVFFWFYVEILCHSRLLSKKHPYVMATAVMHGVVSVCGRM